MARRTIGVLCLGLVGLLPATGVYTLVIDPTLDAVGNLTVALTSP